MAQGKFRVPKKLEPHPGDVHVGSGSPCLRKLSKLSQADLANHIGYGCQLVQWYEPGNVG